MRGPRTLSRRTVLALAVYALVVGGGRTCDAIAGPSQRNARAKQFNSPVNRSTGARSNSKTRNEDADFPAERYAKALNSSKERIRQGIMERILSRHANHPRVAGLLIDAVNSAIESRNVTVSTGWMIRTLGSFQRADVLEALLAWLDEAAQGESVSEHIFEVILALGGFNQPEVHRALIPLLEAKDYRLVILATDVLGQQRCNEVLESIKNVASRPEYQTHYGLRWSVFHAVCQFHNADAIDFLLLELPSLDGQLKFAVVDYLSRISQQSFGSQAHLWRQWWQVARPSFEYDGQDAKEAVPYAWDYPLPSFYENKIYAKRVVFVIDISSTMTKRISGGQMVRLDRAKVELIKAISQLPSDAFFNIVAFDRDIHVWRPRSVTATQLNKHQAIQTVRAIRSGRGTAIFDALEASFGVDRNAEVVYVLSDGLPSAGRIKEPGEILRIVTEANRFRKMSINSISVGRRSELLQRLSRLNNGVYRQSG